MKRNPDAIRTILFAVIGALLIYAMYLYMTNKPKHYIQEEKTINLKDYMRK